MLEKVTRLAEELATGVSRRSFLASFSRWAGATAMAVAGVLTTPRAAHAGSGVLCCEYQMAPGLIPYIACIKTGPCPATGPKGGTYITQFSASGCGQCFQ